MRRRPAGALCVLLMVVGAAPTQQVGSVTGRVTIEGDRAQVRAVPSRYKRSTHSAAPVVPPGPEVENVVVYLEPIGHQVPAPPPRERPRMDQKNQVFIPHVLPITVGTTIDITNQDGIYHNVFSLTDVKKFDIGRRPTGERVPMSFDTPGVVRVFCDIHSKMSAFIVVLDTPLFAKPDAEGAYRITGVPPGRYRLSVWHDEFSAQPREVTVGASGTVQADIVLR